MGIPAGAVAVVEARASDASEATVGDGARTWAAYLRARSVSAALMPATGGDLRGADDICESLNGASPNNVGSSDSTVSGFVSLESGDAGGRFDGSVGGGRALLCSGVRVSVAPGRFSTIRAGHERTCAGRVSDGDAGATGAFVTIVRSSSSSVAGVFVTIVSSSSSRGAGRV